MPFDFGEQREKRKRKTQPKREIDKKEVLDAPLRFNFKLIVNQ
jgi:hypothetical protein